MMVLIDKVLAAVLFLAVGAGTFWLVKSAFEWTFDRLPDSVKAALARFREKDPELYGNLAVFVLLFVMIPIFSFLAYRVVFNFTDTNADEAFKLSAVVKRFSSIGASSPVQEWIKFSLFVSALWKFFQKGRAYLKRKQEQPKDGDD
jgi:hypothetical protein